MNENKELKLDELEQVTGGNLGQVVDGYWDDDPDNPNNDDPNATPSNLFTRHGINNNLPNTPDQGNGLAEDNF